MNTLHSVQKSTREATLGVARMGKLVCWVRRLRAADLGVALGVVIVYLIAVRLGVSVRTPEGITQVRLSAGIAVGAMLVLRPAQRPLIVAALVAAVPLASLVSGKSLLDSLAYVTANAVGALLVVVLIERWQPRPLVLENFKSVLALFAAAAVASIFGQALVALALQATGGTSAPFLIVWRQLAWAYMAGVVLVAPLLIAIAAALRAPPPRHELIEGAVVLVLHALLAAHAFAHVGFNAGHWLVLAPGFSQLPLLLWLSIRCGPLCAAVGSLVLGLVMLGSFGLERGRYGDTDFTLDERALATHFGIVVTSFTALAIAALTAERKRAEATARRGEIAERKAKEETAALLSAIVTSSSDAIVSMAINGTITSWNTGAECLLGYSAAEITGQSIRRIVPPDCASEEDNILARIIAGEIVQPFETKRQRKDGRTLDVSITVSPVRDQAGRVIGASKILRDITERKQAEDALHDSHARLKKVLEVETVGVMFWDLTTGRMTDANDTFLNLMGYSRHDVEAGELTWQKLTPPEYVEASLAEIRKFQACGRIGPYEKEYLRKDGERQWLIFAGSSLGRNACVEFCVDLSGQKKAEAALRESEEQFRTLADAIPQLAWMANADGWLNWYNRRWYEYTGTTPEQMEGWGWQSVHSPETLPAVLEGWNKSIATGEPFEMVFPLRGSDGKFRLFLTRVQPVKNAKGRVVRWFGTNTDVDELKRAEEALRESEERYRGIFQYAGTGIAITDLKGQIRSCNPAYAAMLGRSEEELRSLFFTDLVHPEDREANITEVGRLLAEAMPSFELVNRYVHRDGSPIWVHKRVSLLRDSAGHPTNLITLVTDMTERKRSEAALQASEERLRAIVDTAAEAIIVIDGTGCIESVNPAATRIFGYAPAEMVGNDVSMLMPEPHRSAHSGYIRNYLNTGMAKIIGIGREVEGQRKDGSCFPADLSVVKWHHEGKRYFTGIMRDISERKQREEQVKLLIKEVNHRAKNMLSVVQAIAAQTAARGQGAFMERFTKRLQALATNQDLLVKSEWRGVGLADLVRSQLEHFGDLIGTRVTVEGPYLRISAKAAQAIGMALHELATNAGKYGALSNSSGKVDITWAIGKDGNEEEGFRLSWREQGGPEVHKPTRRGFGTTVIRDMPRLQLAAKVALEYAPGGIVWSVACPAKNALEDAGAEEDAMELAT